MHLWERSLLVWDLGYNSLASCFIACSNHNNIPCVVHSLTVTWILISNIFLSFLYFFAVYNNVYYSRWILFYSAVDILFVVHYVTCDYCRVSTIHTNQHRVHWDCGSMLFVFLCLFYLWERCRLAFWGICLYDSSYCICSWSLYEVDCARFL